MEQQNSLLVDQVRGLYKNLPVANLSTVVISPLLVWVLWTVADQVRLLIWFLFIIGLAGVRSVGAMFYSRAQVNDKNVNIWLDLYLLGVFLSGLGWGSTLIVLVPAGETNYLIATVFILGGMVIGSAASLSSLQYGFSVFSLPAILPGAFFLIYMGGVFEFYMGCALLAFLIFVFVIAQSIHRTIFFSLRRQVEAGNLLSRAETEKEQLTAENTKLQLQLESYTSEINQLRSHLRSIEAVNPDLKRHGEPSLRDGKFGVLLEKVNGGVWDYNHSTGEIIFSSRWLEMLGFDKENASNHIDFWKSLIHPDDKLAVLNDFNAFLEGNAQDFSSSYRLKSKDGDWKWVLSHAQGVIWGNFGEILNIVGIEIDIDSSSRSHSGSMNLTDFNTEEWFYPAEEFQERLHYAVLTSGMDNIEHSLFYIRISNQQADGSMGGSANVVLLHEAGKLLLREFRQGDAIVHLLDDNAFAVLTEFCSLENAWTKARNLQSILSGHKFLYEGIECELSPSIGITPITDAGRDSMTLLADAQKASELAANSPDTSIYLYSGEEQDIAEKFFDRHLGNQIKDAILNKRFTLDVTPLTPLVNDDGATLNLYSVDAWLDFEDPGLFNRAEVSLVMENNRLHADVDLCKINLFYDWLQTHHDHSSQENRVFFMDCSDKSVVDESFHSQISNVLEEHQDMNHMLCIGVSEKVLADDEMHSRQFIDLVKAMGCKCAITDVSTSYLSQKTINSLPLEYLKIDSSLINNLQTDQSSFLTVKYITELSHLADLKSIVENLSNLQLIDTLKSIKVDYVQQVQKQLAPGVS